MSRKACAVLFALLYAPLAAIPAANAASATASWGPIAIQVSGGSATFTSGTVFGSACVMSGGCDFLIGANGAFPQTVTFAQGATGSFAGALYTPAPTASLSASAQTAAGSDRNAYAGFSYTFGFDATAGTMLTVTADYSLYADPGLAPIGGSALANVDFFGPGVGPSSFFTSSLSLKSPDSPQPLSDTFSRSFTMAADGSDSFTFEVFASATEPMAVAAIPEPSTYALMLAGLGLVAWQARRRRAGTRS